MGGAQGPHLVGDGGGAECVCVWGGEGRRGAQAVIARWLKPPQLKCNVRVKERAP